MARKNPVKCSPESPTIPGSSKPCWHDPAELEQMINQELIAQNIPSQLRLRYKHIAAGGSSRVYHARVRGKPLQKSRDYSEVALKVRNPMFAAEYLSDELTRLRREFEYGRAVFEQLAQSEHSEYTLEPLGFGSVKHSSPLLWSMLPYSHLEPLSMKVREQPEGTPAMSVEDSIEVLYALGCVLEAAHGLGIVHRDIKPENILYRPRNHASARMKLIDWGLAKKEDDFFGEKKLIGTPSYGAPEQFNPHEPMTVQADVYAACSTVYEACTGDLPRRINSLRDLQTIYQQDVVAPRDRNPSVPLALNELLLRGLDVVPSRRPTAVELYETAAVLRTNH